MKNMNRYLILLFASCAACFFAGGCFDEVAPGTRADGLTISLFSGELQTRAFDGTFETKIDHFDFFFFKDAAGTQPISGMHARVEASSVTLDTGTDGTYAALRKGTSYVYILANYDGELSHNQDWTLSQLLSLPVNAKIVKEKDEETGDVVFCDHLVMDSYDGTKYTTELTPRQINDNPEVTIGLTRIAAKLTMEVTVAESVGGKLPGEVWTPVRKELKAYFVNALNNHATVSAEPVRRAGAATDYEYLTYPVPYPMTPNPESHADDDYTFITDPVYTYPQVWESDDNGEPYFKIQMTWMSNLRGTANFYYKVTVPKPGEDDKWTLDRNMWYKVKLDLSVIDTENRYITVTGSYTVTPWSSSNVQGGNGLSSARFFDVPATEYELFSESELTIPFSSSSAIKYYFTNISYTHYGPKDDDVYDVTFSYPFTYSFDPDENVRAVLLPVMTNLSKAKDPNEYKLELAADGKSVVFSHNLDKVYTARYITLVIEGEGASATVTITQHPAIEIKKIAADNAFVNGHFGRNNRTVQDYAGNLMGTMFGPTHNYDTGLYKYHSNVNCEEPSEDNNWVVKLKDIGLGDVYIDRNPTLRSGQMFLTEITVTALNDANNTYTMYEEGEASRPREEHYLIGDPRVPASSQYTEADQSTWSANSTTNFWLPNYLKRDTQLRTEEGSTTPPTWNYETVDAEYGEWAEPLKVLITNQNVDARNVIAPRFLLSSALNGMRDPIYYDEAVRRAATYQENGYPAGRWRLPTEAEIAFLCARQREGSLPQLIVLNRSGRYWTAQRSYVKLANADAPSNAIGVWSVGPSGSSEGNYKAWNRYVYDLWYWGDEPVESAKNCYCPNMHER